MANVLNGNVVLMFMLVAIYFPSDRLRNIIVTISDVNWPVTKDMLSGQDFRKCAQQVGDPPPGTVTYVCSSEAIRGRYVYIYGPNEMLYDMIICEVEVGGGEYYRYSL